MLRKLALLLIPLAFVAAACGGNNNDKSSATSTAEATATAAYAPSEPTRIPTTPTPIVIATPNFGGATSLLSAVNPLQLLNGIESGGASQQVSPELKAGLLSPGDLPGGFTPFGDFGFNIPSQYGSMQMAANMFATGDIASGNFGAMVMSAAIVLPPQALDQFGPNGLAELSHLTDADLAQIRQATKALGVTFSDLHVLDGSGLGDGGAGMHMVIDFSGLPNSLSAPEGASNPFQDGLAIDMYMFVRGDHMYMAMVMWPASGSSGVDARALADTLNSRTPL
jgi:hypothetical protein